ncbi:hypothetical protein BH23ACT2_BH23ACT2_10560 [soil metagenome]
MINEALPECRIVRYRAGMTNAASLAVARSPGRSALSGVRESPVARLRDATSTSGIGSE